MSIQLTCSSFLIWERKFLSKMKVPGIPLLKCMPLKAISSRGPLKGWDTLHWDGRAKILMNKEKSIDMGKQLSGSNSVALSGHVVNSLWTVECLKRIFNGTCEFFCILWSVGFLSWLYSKVNAVHLSVLFSNAAWRRLSRKPSLLFKARSHREKLKTKERIFFDICRLFFDLFIVLWSLSLGVNRSLCPVCVLVTVCSTFILKINVFQTNLLTRKSSRLNARGIPPAA